MGGLKSYLKRGTLTTEICESHNVTEVDGDLIKGLRGHCLALLQLFSYLSEGGGVIEFCRKVVRLIL